MAKVSKNAWRKFAEEQRHKAAQTPVGPQLAQSQKKIELKPVTAVKPGLVQTVTVLELRNSDDFPKELHRQVLDKNYIEAAKLITSAIYSGLPALKEENTLKDIRTTIAGLTDQNSPNTNEESVKAAIALIKKCAEQKIIYEQNPKDDFPRITETAIGLGQNYCPADTAYAIIEILNAETLMIRPSTIRVTFDKLQFNNARPENTKAARDLIIKALDLSLVPGVEEDTKFVNRALQKFGNPTILPGEENLLDVANRIVLGCEIAQVSLDKKFSMAAEKTGTRLNCFINDIRKVAVKLRLLGDAIKSGDLNPKINTKIFLNQNELNATGIESTPEAGDTFIKLSNKLLLKAVELAKQGVIQKQAIYPDRLLSTIREFKLALSPEDTRMLQS